MGLLLNKEFVTGSPTSAVPHTFYNDVDEILSNIEIYNGHIERTENFWTIVYDEGISRVATGNDQIQDMAGDWSDGDTTGVDFDVMTTFQWDGTAHKLQYKKRTCTIRNGNTLIGKQDTAWTDITTALACPE